MPTSYLLVDGLIVHGCVFIYTCKKTHYKEIICAADAQKSSKATAMVMSHVSW